MRIERNVIFGTALGIWFVHEAIPGTRYDGKCRGGDLIGTNAGGNVGLGAVGGIEITAGAPTTGSASTRSYGPETPTSATSFRETPASASRSPAPVRPRTVAGNDIGTDSTGTLAIPN